jgi:hypothetical protein
MKTYVQMDTSIDIEQVHQLLPRKADVSSSVPWSQRRIEEKSFQVCKLFQLCSSVLTPCVGHLNLLYRYLKKIQTVQLMPPTVA